MAIKWLTLPDRSVIRIPDFADALDPSVDPCAPSCQMVRAGDGPEASAAKTKAELLIEVEVLRGAISALTFRYMLVPAWVRWLARTVRWSLPGKFEWALDDFRRWRRRRREPSEETD
jgi:hypothetical protein